MVTPCRSYGGGLVTNGCVGEYQLARDVAFRDRPFFDRPDGLPGDAIQDEEEALLGRLRQRLDRPAVNGDVHQDGRARDVPVPDAVMDRLVVPLALTGREIQREDALAEEPVARPVAAVVIAGRHLDAHVDGVELLIDAHLRPHAGVAGVGPRILEPRIVAELAGARHGMKDPAALAGAHVVGAHIANHRLVVARRAALDVRRTDDDGVLRNDRRGVQSDLVVQLVDLLIVVLLQIDDAVHAEGGDAMTSSRIERDHLVSGRDVNDPCFLAVAPVREPAARQLSRRHLAALALVEAVHPEQLAGRRVERHGRAPGARREIQDAIYHQRRRLKVEFRPRPERLGLEAEGDFELAEVLGVDLVERRVASTRKVSAVGAPFAVHGLAGTAWHNAEKAEHGDRQRSRWSVLRLPRSRGTRGRCFR